MAEGNGPAGPERPKDPYKDLRDAFSFKEEPEEGRSASDMPKTEATAVAVAAGLAGEVGYKIYKKLRQREGSKVPGAKKQPQTESKAGSRTEQTPPPTGSEAPPPAESPKEPPKPPEAGAVKETPGGRSFRDIQDDLLELIDNPNPQREAELKFERARLLRDAKDWKLFDSIKRHIFELQDSNNFRRAAEKISGIDTVSLEAEARGAEGWDKKWEGMLEEYKEVAVLNMQLALLTAQGGASQSVLNNLEREISLRGWGMSRDVEILATAYVNSLRPQPAAAETPETQMLNAIRDLINELRLQGSHELTTDRLREAFGQIAPEDQRKIFVDIEESGEALLEIPPLSSKIWEGLDQKEKKFWQARLKLSNARAYKQVSGEELSRNKFLADLTKEELTALTGLPGAAEAISIYTVFIYDPNFSDGIKDRIGMTKASMLPIEIKEKPGVLVSKTVKKIEGVEKQEDLRAMRGEVRSYLSLHFGLKEEDARIAEQIAYNFIYVNNMVEESDHTGDPRGAFSNLMNEGLRDSMHPLSKLLDAINTGTVGDRWPLNEMGEWARYHRERLLKHPDQVPITDNLFLSFPNWANSMGRGTDEERGRSLGVNGPLTLKEYLLQTGRHILSGNISAVGVAKIDWNSSKAIEKPYGRYLAVQVGRGDLIYQTLKDGSIPRDKKIFNVQNAFRPLNVDDTTRKSIAFAIYDAESGWINPKKREYRPDKSGRFMSGFWTQFKKQYPGYFSH